jgi:hypothetical protein
MTEGLELGGTLVLAVSFSTQLEGFVHNRGEMQLFSVEKSIAD